MKKIPQCSVYLYGVEDKQTGKLMPDGITPVFKTKGAACADCATPFEVKIPPHKTVKIPLRVGFDIPKGYKILMYPRSSLLVKHDLISPVSVIDSDFSPNEVSFPIHNLSSDEVILQAGERVCQIELVKAMDHASGENWAEEDNKRDPNGFGGTGKI